ncbi:unnamed protein product [Discosporangium mesarthrocarpum]
MVLPVRSVLVAWVILLQQHSQAFTFPAPWVSTSCSQCAHRASRTSFVSRRDGEHSQNSGMEPRKRKAGLLPCECGVGRDLGHSWWDVCQGILVGASVPSGCVLKASPLPHVLRIVSFYLDLSEVHMKLTPKGEDSGSKVEEEGGDGEGDPRFSTVRISRATGIDYGTDLSFKWVFVRNLDPSGSGALCGKIAPGDQLVAINGETMAGAPFDYAMAAMASLEGSEVELTFFRGSKSDLQDVLGAEAPPETIRVTVKQKGQADVQLTAPSGTNLRNLMVENGINVYQSVTRWTNCKGKQLCGTCIVSVDSGLDSCTIKSIDEQATLRENPDSYRLSCVTNMYGDVTVTVFPPVGAAQWTK